jgi:hypothetical protein
MTVLIDALGALNLARRRVRLRPIERSHDLLDRAHLVAAVLAGGRDVLASRPAKA